MSIDLFLGECKRMETALKKMYNCKYMTIFYTKYTPFKATWGRFNYLTNEIKINIGGMYNFKNDAIGRMRFIMVYSHEYTHSIFRFENENFFDMYSKDENFVKAMEVDCKIRTCNLLRENRDKIIGTPPFNIPHKIFSVILEAEAKEAFDFYRDLYLVRNELYDKYKIKIKELNKGGNLYYILDEFKKNPIIHETIGFGFY